MGRTSSKIKGGGGGGGIEIKDIPNDTLRKTLQNIDNDLMLGKTYSHARSQKDGKTIDKNTEVGDVFSHGSVSYRKTGANQWAEVGDIENTFESDGMARILAGFAALPGKWMYKKK